jgi:chemotaxis protein methyltransferase CheR
MEQQVFEKFRRLIYDKSGISLGPQKVSLVSARVGRRMRDLALHSHDEYLNTVLKDESGAELVHLLDAVSTNVTSFFREAQHFEFFSERLRQWSSEGQNRFRIWCAAASTGEEPFTIAMTMLEALPSGMDIKILGTDISTRVLQACMAGIYPEAKIDGIPRNLLAKYYTKQTSAGGAIYSVNNEMRKMMTFRRMNLSTPPYPMKGPMDVIFCRNVMIYFDGELRGKIAEQAHRLLRPGGYLIIGHSESLMGTTRKFKVVMPSVYQKL